MYIKKAIILELNSEETDHLTKFLRYNIEPDENFSSDEEETRKANAFATKLLIGIDDA